MEQYDTVIRQVRIVDGSGHEPEATLFDVAITDGRIAAIATSDSTAWLGDKEIAGDGRVLAPGFIDVHTHDDTNVIRTPDMLPKVSQGITTVIVGNCGISASPATLKGDPPDPMNLLGPASAFAYPTFASYVEAVERAQPAVNVAALVGHTALRNNHLDRLDRPATADEVAGMRAQLREALDNGALGLSTGLAYANAFASTTEEVMGLAEPLAQAGAIYTTHLRTEFAAILDAMDEAYRVGKHARVPIVISHLKCAGAANWGRAGEVLASIESAQRYQPVGCDCYPYTASSSTLDLKQVTDEFDIFITWSEPHPGMAGQTLKDIAAAWGTDLMEAARRLQPAGAVYHNMSAQDLDRIITHPATVIGSDGLPNDPKPHPRLWGAFPRVLGYYSRERKLLSLAAAVRKMTGQSAERFGLAERGLLREGYWADLVLFDPDTVRDVATFTDPQQPAAGIVAVWVNGHLSYREGAVQPRRAGRFLRRALRAHAAPATEAH
ncbi:amidohydrolase family protein [Ralstonia mannitolilytica]|uniref:D-aminoacylase n=1 Tax=Ralstonia mannitolilytica TaxID=105219 RepID=UPI000CEE7368|nr:amidohydrolase family protein [Ralstonia mannitolilytica]MBU9580433.1 amidohydrolase family protein [Ralstonia mannitolilytica]